MPGVLVAGATATQNSTFSSLSGGLNHRQYSLRLPTEGWPGWVGPGGWLRNPSITRPNTNRAQWRSTALIWDQRVTATLNRHMDEKAITEIYLLVLSEHHAGQMKHTSCKINPLRQKNELKSLGNILLQTYRYCIILIWINLL